MAVEEAAPGVFRIFSTLGSRWLQQWLVKGSGGALLLDTGIAGETVRSEIEPALRAISLEPSALEAVVISHADIDHYGGNGELKDLAADALIHAHGLDRPLIESVARISDERYGWYRAHGLDYAPEVWSWIRDAAGPDTALGASLADGESLEVGGTTFEVLHLPGHSAGHIGLHHPDTGSALIGDAVMGRGFSSTAGRPQVHPPAYEDVDACFGTIARLRELAPARLCTGHFPVMEGDDVIAFLDRSASFIDDVDAAVLAEVGGQPRTLASLLPDCARRLGGFAEMEIELARTIAAHLDRLEAAGAVQSIDANPPSWRRVGA